ncbi:MAG: hypothetical protein MZV64_44785 [Ignavibacteriales bacterium]|nr:hypothetical protein [Ignavibacteriales bacterium]
MRAAALGAHERAVGDASAPASASSACGRRSPAPGSAPGALRAQADAAAAHQQLLQLVDRLLEVRAACGRCRPWRS